METSLPSEKYLDGTVREFLVLPVDSSDKEAWLKKPHKKFS